MPRLPFFILTALQLIDAGSPMDTSVGSFGGVYEAVIHLALCKDAPNQAAITSERAYLEELAYWCESQPDSPHRQAFNQWFADRKAILLKRVEELEMSLSIKGFISRRHQGFRFNYQRYYFLASFLRDNPNRVGVDEYISKLIANCWNEDYANTALFLAYLQPSSRLINALLAEARRLFQNHSEFELGSWKIDSPFPQGFFRGLTFTRDPESNRRLLAERLDAENPVSSAECESGTSTVLPDVNGDPFLDFLRGFHVIKLIGQLIRNSPIALDAEQKRDMVCAGFDLSLRLISFMGEICSPAAVQAHAVNELRTRVLKKSDRFQLEAQLTGLTYNLTLFLTLTPLRHASFYLAHPDLKLIYQDVLRTSSHKRERLSHKVLACGLHFELRSPDIDLLRKVYHELTPPGKDILHLWTWLYLSFNKVPVTKRQAILDSVGMSSSVQLLLPREVS